jgi:hypothetical protein
VILALLPWLDHSPVRSIRYRPDWHKPVYGVFFVAFLVLGYLGTQLPTPAYTLHRPGLHAAVLQLLPADAMVEHVGPLQAGPDPRDLHPALTQAEPKDNHELFEEIARGPGLAAGIRVRQRRDGFPLDRAPDRRTSPRCKTAPSCSSTTA